MGWKHAVWQITHCRRGTRRVLVKVGTEDGAWRSQERSYAASFHGHSSKGTLKKECRDCGLMLLSSLGNQTYASWTPDWHVLTHTCKTVCRRRFFSKLFRVVGPNARKSVCRQNWLAMSYRLRRLTWKKQVPVPRLASQSVLPDQMVPFVGRGPKWSAGTLCSMKSHEHE